MIMAFDNKLCDNHCLISQHAKKHCSTQRQIWAPHIVGPRTAGSAVAIVTPLMTVDKFVK